ncbi:serine hydrolase domain-containing protein [Nonomuraea dietziae]|uniref:CubicO group peptidase (Beta-lactamase class C family) n=1 Tax=Nonomuraea dietziae TaxID=65515 RepID=A0A7W5V341_9ACTN|nr:serine hydrolase domain-containing protein [Nonomuraea dietziae]MBB3729612.1 CubicO group peptidase (beta-lactamase class C family) [Nonomuraea dietziae]
MFQRSGLWPTPGRLASALVAAGLAAVVAFVVAPTPPRLGSATTGDHALAEAVRRAAGSDGHRALSVALIENGVVRTAGVGDTGGPAPRSVDASTPFEIGSVGKALTGMILADMVAKDGLDPRSPVPGLQGSITYEELASHRSGLPRLAGGLGPLVRGATANYTHGNPYAGQDVSDVREAANSAELSGRGTVAYSNLGMSVLGHALGERAKLPYADMLKRRVLEPLGMKATTTSTPPAGRAHGYVEAGHEADPWTSDGYAPAGMSIWSTSADLALLVDAMLKGGAPGSDAATPRFTDDDTRRIGYGWYTTRTAKGEVTWHNGGTGGFRAYVGFDRAGGRGVVVLGNTDRDVDHVGLRLLGHEGPRPASGDPLLLVITVGLLLAAVVTAWEMATRRTPTRNRPQADRLGIVSMTANAALVLWVAWMAGAWGTVPFAVFILVAAATAAGTALHVARWRELPTARQRSRWLSTVVGLVLDAVIVALLLFMT